MKTKHLDINLKYHARRAGGLFLGFRFDFPRRVCPATEPNNMKYVYDIVDIQLGLLVFSVFISVKHNYVKLLPQ